jgi:hypothetical protein
MSRTDESTPSKLVKLRELRAGGASLRDAAASLGVSHETARKWEARAARGSLLAPADVEAASVALASPPPTADGPEGLAMARARHELLRGLLVRLTPAVEAGEYPAPAFVQLAKYADVLAELVHSLAPKPPVDPDTAPDAMRDAAELIRRVEGLIVVAECSARAVKVPT